MRRVNAEWTDKQGFLHQVDYHQHTSREDQDYHLGVGSIVVVDPVNARKKNPHRGRVFTIDRFRYWHSVARAILVPAAEGPEASAEIGDLRLATEYEINLNAETSRKS